MSVLPVHRDTSPASSSTHGAQLNVAGSSRSTDGTSTQVGADDDISADQAPKQGASVPGKLVKDEKEGKEYLEKGMMELEEDGQKRKVMLVVEQKSGKEMFKDAGGGPYTQPRW